MSRSAQADCSQAAVDEVMAMLDRIPVGAVFVENWPRLLAHQRCRELDLQQPAVRHLKGGAQRIGFTAAELRRDEGLAGIYRLKLR